MPMAETPFSTVATLATKLAANSKRLEKRRLIAEYLSFLRPDEIPPAVLLLVGKIFPEREQKALNVGWATLRKALGPHRPFRRKFGVHSVVRNVPATMRSPPPNCTAVGGVPKTANAIATPNNALVEMIAPARIAPISWNAM